jgi:hypothetical protein
MGKHDIASKAFDRMIKLNPSIAEPWTRKAESLVCLGMKEEAKACSIKQQH